MVALDQGLAKLQGLKPCFFQWSIVAAKAATHNAYFVAGPKFVGHGFGRAINRLERAALAADCFGLLERHSK
jgi:hypothetical protein